MKLPVIAMDRIEARRAFLEYRNAVRANLDREAETLDAQRREVLGRRRQTDEAMMAGYRQLAAGHQIIDLARAIGEAGENDRWLPKLAVCRADFERVRVRRDRDGSLFYRAGSSMGPWPADGSRMQKQFSFPPGTLPTLLNHFVSGDAIVPTIPPRYRPVQLERYHVLWEATWQNIPPGDPALLRALGGGLYAVMATWDLTEIERTVLGILRRA